MDKTKPLDAAGMFPEGFCGVLPFVGAQVIEVRPVSLPDDGVFTKISFRVPSDCDARVGKLIVRGDYREWFSWIMAGRSRGARLVAWCCRTDGSDDDGHGWLHGWLEFLEPPQRQPEAA